MSHAATITGLAPTNANTATFRAWGANVSAQLSAAGLIQTSDSGQINWGTVTTPGAINTMQGYEIWRFDDAFQATSPVFFKIEYGSAFGAANNPSILITLGSGSNGSGQIKGMTSGRWGMNSNGASTNTISNSYFSGAKDRFSMALWVLGAGMSSYYALTYSIERTLNANGNTTGEGILISCVSNNGYKYNRLWDSVLGIQMVESGSYGFGILMPSGVTTGVNGANTAIYPHFFTKANGGFHNPGLNLVGYFNNDLTTGVANTLPMYGVNHTYMPLGNTFIYGTSTRGGNPSTVAMRYE